MRTTRQLPRRLTQLYVGLVAYAVSMALLIRSDLGNMPWDVLNQGLSRRVGGSIGFWVIVGGGIVLLFWIPLRQWPGLGTVSNIVVIGVFVDVALSVTPTPHAMVLRGAYVAAGIVVNAIATGLYVGARMGPGPRDGLMTGLVRRTGRSVRLVRTSIEVVVVIAGILLGGTFGVGTLLYAVAIGPLVQVFLPRFTVPERAPISRPTPAAAADTLAA